jgi:methylthioribose-1-phosphate isomerase
MSDRPTDRATPPDSGSRAPDRDAAEALPPGGPADADLARRRFFRQFAGEMFQTAATLVGAAQALRDSSAQAARAILDPEQGAAMLSALAPADQAPAAPEPGAAPSGFRTPFRFADDPAVLLVVDQRRLPDELVEFEVRSAADAVKAIREMIVRGAPAIGQVAALGLALSARLARLQRPYVRRANLRGASRALIAARPTAVNLRWAVDRLMDRYEAVGGLAADGELVASALRAEADAIVWEATTDHGRIAEFGLAELPQPEGRPLRLLTHCNTGPLACGQYGTALGIVQAAHHAERPVHVWVDETRPYLQGARLTAWELRQAGVPHTLIADVAAGSLMRGGEVDAVLVGADRIAANGDTANKVGTYPLAVLAERHGVPFYVVAPLSSVDLATPHGEAILIEERPAEEVLLVRGRAIAPAGTEVRNPAFDVTPAELITGIVTEEGVLRAPFGPALAAAFERSTARRAAGPSPFAPPAAPPAGSPGEPASGPAPGATDRERVGA